ncbi:MAG: hypothetical protein ABIJ96_17000 [Elusimicrobiota bacterium]
MGKKKKSPAAPAQNRRRTVLLLACGVAAGLLAAEGASRILFKKNVAELAMTEADLYYYYDPAGVRRHIPNKKGYERMWNNQGKAEFRINPYGFRGREIPRKKPPGVFRILFLGDSITLGGRLPEEEIFVERVGRTLGDGEYQVINAGFGDIGLAEEDEVLRTTGIGLEPDLVVLCWYLNDGRPPVGFPEEVVYGNPLIRWFHRSGLLRRSYLMGLLYGTLRKSLVTQQIKLSATQSKRFAWTRTYMEGAWVKDTSAFNKLVHQARFDWGDAWNADSRRAMFKRIRAMRDFARGRGAKFSLVMLPLHAQVYATIPSPVIDEPQKELAEFCRSAGIPCLDLLPTLRAVKHTQIFYDNCHYTPKGNALVADIITAFLRKTGQLPAAANP